MELSSSNLGSFTCNTKIANAELVSAYTDILYDNGKDIKSSVTYIEDKYITTSGTITSASGYCYSNAIALKLGDTVSLKAIGGSSGSTALMSLVQDEESLQNIIVLRSTTKTFLTESFEYTAPSDCFIRISCRSGQVLELLIKRDSMYDLMYSDVIGKKSFQSHDRYLFGGKKNILPEVKELEIVNGKFFNAGKIGLTVTIGSSEYYSYTSSLKIRKGETLSVTIQGGASDTVATIVQCQNETDLTGMTALAICRVRNEYEEQSYTPNEDTYVRFSFKTDRPISKAYSVVDKENSILNICYLKNGANDVVKTYEDTRETALSASSEVFGGGKTCESLNYISGYYFTGAKDTTANVAAGGTSNPNLCYTDSIRLLAAQTISAHVKTGTMAGSIAIFVTCPNETDLSNAISRATNNDREYADYEYTAEYDTYVRISYNKSYSYEAKIVVKDEDSLNTVSNVKTKSMFRDLYGGECDCLNEISTTISGYYLAGTIGSSAYLATHNNYCYTEAYPLRSGETISAYLRMNCAPGTAAAIVTCPNKDDLVGSVVRANNTIWGSENYEYTADENTFVRFSMNLNTPYRVKKLTKKENSIYDLVHGDWGNITEQILQVNQKCNSISAELSACDGKIEMLLNRVMWLGDSLTYGTPTYNPPRLMKMLTGLEVSSLAFGGWQAEHVWNAWYNDGTHKFEFTDYDTYIIWLGLNGQLLSTDLQPDVLDHGTDWENYGTSLVGYYCKILTKIITDNPNARIFLASMQYQGDKTIVIRQISNLEMYQNNIIGVLDMTIFHDPINHVGQDTIHFGRFGNYNVAYLIIRQLRNFITSDISKFEY